MLVLLGAGRGVRIVVAMTELCIGALLGQGGRLFH